MSDEPPIVEIKAVNIMDWVMDEGSGKLVRKAIRHELRYRRQGWHPNHWEALQVEEEELKNE